MDSSGQRVPATALSAIKDVKPVPSAKDASVVEEGTPKGQLSWFSGMCMVIGMMVGSGIFVTPGSVAKQVGAPGIAMMFWVLGGLVTLAGTFSYMELGTMFPKSGGEKEYLGISFPNPRGLIPFLFCWSIILLVRPGSAAADAVIFAKYTLYGFKEEMGLDEVALEWVIKCLAVFCLTIITFMNIVGPRFAIKVHDALTLIKVLVLSLVTIMGILVAAGAYKIDKKPDNWSNAFAGASTSGSAYASAMFAVFWAFDGWNNLNYAAGELKDPIRNLPRAAASGVSIVILLYLLANFSFLSVLSADTMREAGEDLAAIFFSKLFGKVMGEKVMPIFIGLALFGTVIAMIYSASRVTVAAAEANLLPFSSYLRRESRWGSPIYALLLNYVIALLLTVAPPLKSAFDFLLELVGYPTWIFYGLAVAGLIRMRWTHAHIHRPIRMFLPVSAFFILVAVYLSIFPFFPKDTDSPIPYWMAPTAGLTFILAGVPVWYYVYYKHEEKWERQEHA